MKTKIALLISIVILAFIAIAGWLMFFAKKNAIAALNATDDSRQKQIEALHSDISTKTDQLNALQSTLESERIALRTANIEVDQLKNNVLCPGLENYTFNFTNNTTISQSLETLTQDKYGKVLSSSWDVVWSNSRTSIHSLYFDNNLKAVFVVVFADEDSGANIDRIFWVSKECIIQSVDYSKY